MSLTAIFIRKYVCASEQQNILNAIIEKDEFDEACEGID